MEARGQATWISGHENGKCKGPEVSMVGWEQTEANGQGSDTLNGGRTFRVLEATVETLSHKGGCWGHGNNMI